MGVSLKMLNTLLKRGALPMANSAMFLVILVSPALKKGMVEITCSSPSPRSTKLCSAIGYTPPLHLKIFGDALGIDMTTR